MTPSKAFLTVMGLLLLGYAFFDKGFALLPQIGRASCRERV